MSPLVLARAVTQLYWRQVDYCVHTVTTWFNVTKVSLAMIAENRVTQALYSYHFDVEFKGSNAVNEVRLTPQ